MDASNLPLPWPQRLADAAWLRARARGLARLLAEALGLAGLGLMALLLGGLADAPPQRVAVAPGDERALVGFYEREESPGGALRWARPGSALFLYGFDGRPALLDLRLNAARPGDAPAALDLIAAGRPLGTVTVASSWRRYLLLAPTSAAGDTGIVLGGDAFRAAGDERDLLVALSAAAARPGDVSPLPPPQRALFLLSLPLAAWALLRRHGRLNALALGLAPLPALAWAAARPAEAGYWLPTFGWPLGLPLALGLGYVALRALDAAGARIPLIGARAAVRGEALALTGITLGALALRLYALGDLPLGLWRDEARHGLLALQIWRDPAFRPVYVVEGADLPALLFYLMAPVVGTLGPGVASLRLVSALAGALAPLALWWAARPLIGPRAAVLAAALLAWSSWSLGMSRWAFPATLDQLLTLAALGLALRALPDKRPRTKDQRSATEGAQYPGAHSGRPWSFVSGLWPLSGALAGLAAYAYHTGRLAPVTLAALVALWLGRDRAAWRRAIPGLAAAALIGLLVLVPLLRFVAEDFAGYNRRTGAVAFYNDEDAAARAPLLLLLRNGERYLLMWHVAGERNGRHHAPGAPMLDPLSGGLLALGLAGAVAARRDRRMLLLPAWLALGLVPGMLSTGAPHAMRALPALAPACALAGLALSWLLGAAEAPLTRRLGERGRPAAMALVYSALLVSVALNLTQYFVENPLDPRVQEAFDVPETLMGQLARAALTAGDPALREVRVFLPAAARRSEVVRFLADGAAPRYYDPDTGFSEPPGAQALILLPAGASDELRSAARAALGPGARELPPPRYPDGSPALAVYGVGDQAARLLGEVFPAR